MTTIARQQTLDSVPLLAGNLAAWVPLAISIVFLTQAADPLRSTVIYLGFGAPVILVLTLLAERPLLIRLRERSERIVEWAVIAASGASLALPGAVVLAIVGAANDPSWTVVGAAVGAVACGFSGVFVGLVGRALYPSLNSVRPLSWILVIVFAALTIAASVLIVRALG